MSIINELSKKINITQNDILNYFSGLEFLNNDNETAVITNINYLIDNFNLNYENALLIFSGWIDFNTYNYKTKKVPTI